MAAVHPSALKQDWSFRYGPPCEITQRLGPYLRVMHFLGCAHNGAALVCHMGFPDLDGLGLGAAGPAMRVPPTRGITGDAQIGAPCILCLPLVFRKHHARGFCSRPPHASPKTPCGPKIGPLAACPHVWGMRQYTDQEIPPQVRPEAYTAPWSCDFALLLQLSFSPAPPGSVCV